MKLVKVSPGVWINPEIIAKVTLVWEEPYVRENYHLEVTSKNGQKYTVIGPERAPFEEQLGLSEVLA